MRQPADLFRLEFEPLKAAIVARREALSAQRRAEGERPRKRPPRRRARRRTRRSTTSSPRSTRAGRSRSTGSCSPSASRRSASRRPRRWRSASDMQALMAAPRRRRPSPGRPRLAGNSRPCRGSVPAPATSCSRPSTRHPASRSRGSASVRACGAADAVPGEAVLAHYGSEADAEAALERASGQKPGEAYRVFADDGEVGPSPRIR